MDPKYLILCFHQNLIVLAQGGAEDDTGDAFKTMDPLLAFGSLTANIEEVYSGNDKHVVNQKYSEIDLRQWWNTESCLSNARASLPAP